MVSLGIEEFLRQPPGWAKGRRLGLLCNQASICSDIEHSKDRICELFPSRLTALFTPQHGFYSEKQDNMIESGHGIDPQTGVPVFSLYGDVRKPTKEMFDCIDVLLVDLFDVGTRVYTFMYTLAYCLERAVELGKKVLILDRPNPINGVDIEGNILREENKSFVGLYPLPMRHGLTFGELGAYINAEFDINADLEVIKMRGWNREMFFEDTGLPFVYPSPNMPTAITAMVYPGQVIWEGTNISEGRGTTLPFEVFGAPFLDQEKVLDYVGTFPLPGCYMRRILFEPTSNKWAGRTCSGFQIHVTDGHAFRPYRTALAFLQAIMHVHPEHFSYKEPPYEYEYKKLPMDLILGDRATRTALENGADILELESSWNTELESFDAKRRGYFLYS